MILIDVGAVVEPVIGVGEVGRVIQGQNTVLACLKVLGELHSDLLVGFVLQYSHISGGLVTQLEERKDWSKNIQD